MSNLKKYGKAGITDDFKSFVAKNFDKEIDECSDVEKFEALVACVNSIARDLRIKTVERRVENKKLKKVYYFSMEFLIGRLLENYLVNLNIKEEVEEELAQIGVDVKKLYEVEPDPGLGNGGLGRLAACFLDSMAAVGIPGTGIGLRYNFGLFRQKIENGQQVELPDAWLENGYPWENCRAEDAVEVHFGGEVARDYYDGEMHYEYRNYWSVNAVPYDIPVVGQDGETVNMLRLFEARPIKPSINMEAFNRGDYAESMREKCEIEAITSILYPDDSTGIGRKLRLRQEYLMVAGGLGMIVKTYKRHYGNKAWSKFPDRISIHINDTHPTLCIPELMRILIDEEDLDWDQAWEITTKTMSFTNHTVLPEASERWDINLMRSLLPRVYMMIEEIDRRFREYLDEKVGITAANLGAMAVLWNDEVRMANLSVIGSHSVNGVAALHSDILKDYFFHDFYKVYPERFNNKTNGISHRRFMIQSNPGLAALIDEYTGTGWRHDFSKIKKLLEYKDDADFLKKLGKIKKENKKRLAEYVEKQSGLKLNTNSVFDVQVKRFHAYKRQLLNVFKVMNYYNRIKHNPHEELTPVTFIFSGKAAQGYYFAKEIIRLIISMANLVNNDPDCEGKMQVVFVENFCVSNAQLIYPAADISEQISTAGKEASGTGNMKFMMNGAVTLGTMDGANIEITGEAGIENEFIFGLSSDEVQHYHDHGGYSAEAVCNSDPRLQKITTQLIDGTLNGPGGVFWNVYDELLRRNDEFFVLADFDDYVRAFDDLLATYSNKKKWQQISLENIANSSFFSSDRTICEYADEIWHIEHK